MITKKENAKQREFKGVSFDVLAVGEKSMVTRMNYKIGERTCTCSSQRTEWLRDFRQIQNPVSASG